MLDLLRLIRAHNLLLAAAGVLAGAWIALGHLAMPAPLFWAALSGAGLGMVGNVLNDIWDESGDRVNGRADRPLAAGRVSRGTADLCVLWGTLVGLGGAALVSGTMAALALVALGVMAAYSPLLKRRGIAGNAAVALVAGFPLAYGALAVGRGAAGLVPWVLAAWLHLGRELAKDLVDIPGDRVLGRRTVPILFGETRAVRVTRSILWCFIPLSLLPLFTGYGWWYAPFLLAADGLVLAATRWLGLQAYAGAVRTTKLAMPVGVIGLVLGRVM